MSENDLHYRGLLEIAEQIRCRKVSPVAVTEHLLDRIGMLEPQLHSYATVMADSALIQARKAEAEINAGLHRGVLHGVPVALKDLCFTADAPTACGMPLLAEHRPEYDATIVTRLKQAGAIILGKLQMTEAALGAHHPSIAAPVNPWDKDYSSGYSSSGSGVAAAAGLCFASTGSDTGGSIRFPSAANGCTGLKPTWGRVSRYGIFPLADSLDTVGPMARNAADAAAMLSIIAGADAADPTSCIIAPSDYCAELDLGVRGLKVGVDWRSLQHDTDDEIMAALGTAASVFADLGASVQTITLPSFDNYMPSLITLLMAEAAVAHDPYYPSQAEAYGERLRAVLDAGAKLGGKDVAKAIHARLDLQGRLATLFNDVDLLLLPVTPISVQTLTQQEEMMSTKSSAPRNNFAFVCRYAMPFNASGHPSLTMTGGFNANGLPISFQLIGRHFNESTLFRAGHAFQKRTDWHTRHPNL